MSKEPQFNDEQPPPYTESPSAGAGTAGNARLHASLTTSLTSPLAAHLHALPDRMRATEQARSTQQAAFDLELITLLIPHVQAFLSDLGNMPSSPAVAELTLVPAAVVPKIWSLSGAAERRREGETLRIARVEGPSDLGSKKKSKEKGSKSATGSASTSSWITSVDIPPSSSTYGFDSSSRTEEDDDDGIPATQANKSSWWWEDERMARRLAAYLQPKMVHTERRQIQAVVERAKEDKKSSWGWGRKKTAGSSSSTPVASQPPPPRAQVVGAGDSVLGELDERVSMSVRADEVTFRRENDFGVWESLTGFGIVLVVRIRR